MSEQKTWYIIVPKEDTNEVECVRELVAGNTPVDEFIKKYRARFCFFPYLYEERPETSADVEIFEIKA